MGVKTRPLRMKLTNFSSSPTFYFTCNFLNSIHAFKTIFYHEDKMPNGKDYES